MRGARFAAGPVPVLLAALLLAPVAFAGDGPPLRSAGELFDLKLLWVRLVIAALAALLLASLVWFSRPERVSAFSTARAVALGLLAVLALAAFSANYNFFVWRRIHGIHAHDVFHYYVGAKYFPELGYFDLYRCSLAVAGQTTPGATAAAAAVGSRTPVRDLRTRRLEPAAKLKPSGPRCDGLFEPERWRAFERDVRWFQARLRGPKWKNVLTDHGFNPSPVWLLFGRWLAEVVPAKAIPMRLAVRIDLLLLLAAFAAVARAFGFTGLCVAVIAWGTNPLSRYQWVGDAFLRTPWLVAGLVGVCCLKRRRSAAAGSFLALAALLRLFPGFALACLGVHALGEAWRRRALAPEAVRLAAGAGLAAVVLVAAGIGLGGRGADAYQQFADNIVPHSQILTWSSVGLRPLLGFALPDSPVPDSPMGGHLSPMGGHLDSAPTTQEGIQQAKRALADSRWFVYWPTLALFGALLFRALSRCQAWEAAALGVVPALLLTSMVSYYVAIAVFLALLATQRPRIGIALMLALVGWCTSAIAFYDDRMEFVIASIIALALALYTLVEMQWRENSQSG